MPQRGDRVEGDGGVFELVPAQQGQAQVRKAIIGKALAVASSYFTLYKVSVSYAHTGKLIYFINFSNIFAVKASMPLFAVVFSHFILHEKQSARVYVSLLPVMAGVIIASATELTYSSVALATALFSTGTYSFLNILVKKVGFYVTVFISKRFSY